LFDQQAENALLLSTARKANQACKSAELWNVSDLILDLLDLVLVRILCEILSCLLHLLDNFQCHQHSLTDGHLFYLIWILFLVLFILHGQLVHVGNGLLAFVK
jgi:hypothetical protein